MTNPKRSDELKAVPMTSKSMETPSLPIKPGNARPLAHLFEQVVNPHERITDIQTRRQSRLLSILILVINSLVPVLYGLAAIATPGYRPPLLGWIYIAIVYGLYGLNRAGYYKVAYPIYLSITYIIPFAVVLSGGRIENLYILTIAGILASIFASYRVFFLFSLFAVVNLLGLTFGDFLAYDVDGFAMFFNTLSFGLLLLFRRYRDLLERDRQAELKAANERLEERVEERTKELAIAKEDAELARDQALKADQLKSQFLASMSHELRTPLNAILNFNEMISLGMVGDVNKEQVSLLNKSLDSGKHLLQLINDVLDISKIQADMLTLFLEDDVDLNKEVESVLDTAQGIVDRKRTVTLVEDIDPNLPSMSVDRRRFRQILLNLISNAIKFTEEGTVTVSAKVRPDRLLFSVLDTGIGIPEEEFGRIFEPFEQTESGAKEYEGTGLGLPISKRLVEAHGGKLRVESTPGEGSNFTFEIPRSAK